MNYTECMRKFFLAALALLILLAPAKGVQADTQDFIIRSFSGDYYLSRGEGTVAELRVVEKIIAEFPQFDQNHGILRAIPQNYQGHPLELRITRVANDKGELQYNTYEENDNLVLRIGDPDAYAHGATSYVIEYTMRGVSLNLQDHQEFYWDINGDQWQQPFGKVEARVHIPADLVANLQQKHACYAGGNGENNNTCTIRAATEPVGTVVEATTTNPLVANQTLTVVLGFSQGTFAAYAPSARQINEWLMTALGVAVPPLLAIAFVIYKWRRKGRDPKGKGVVVAQFLPPKDLSVLESSALLKERFDPHAVSATIIDLAVRHYIKVYETKADKMFSKAEYEFELVKEPVGLRIDESAVLAMVFGAKAVVGNRVALASLKAKLSTKAEKIGKEVNEQLATTGYFRLAPHKAKTPYYVAGGVLLMAGFFLLTSGQVFGVGLLLAGAIFCAGGHVMPARTAKGVEAKDYLLGLRDYMKLAEADRLAMLQSPRGDLTEKIDVSDTKKLVKLYEKLLPYAMLFGIEKDWSAQMASLYQQPPDWYSGTSTFNAVWFASSLSSFNDSSSAAFAPPSSSSSSGFGGSSGGGGGGGGGGGW